MTTILKETSPVARKPHVCDLCDCQIQPGDRYHRTEGVSYDYDGFFTWKACAPCRALTAIVWEHYGRPSEGVGIDDFDEWAKEFPEDPMAKAFGVRRWKGR